MEKLRDILEKVKDGAISIDEAIAELKLLLYRDLFFAKIDTGRSLRKGLPEVILAEGKSPDQVRRIVLELLHFERNILITRANEETYNALRDIEGVKYYREARVITIKGREVKKMGSVAVVTGGTADIRVAEEAAITAEFFGANVIRVYDVGVAGVHRLFDHLEEIRKCDVVIVCAGMDAALFSVVAGLVDAPVIAVPTSVGYGASFGGLSALLSALNSCVPGVAVVNIDNGFGAGYLAALIIRKIYQRNSSRKSDS
ncbi:MAG: nickel pincer cofactor biosynthesis protein LarB [Candidatus Njordarchaeales archaeon]